MNALRRAQKLWFLTLALCVVGFTTLQTIAVAPAGATTTSPSMTLRSQSDWVQADGQFEIGFALHSTFLPSQVAVKIAVYPHLSSVSAFDSSLTQHSLRNELPLTTTSSLALAPSIAPVNGAMTIALHLDVTSSASSTSASSANTTDNPPPLNLDCQIGSCAGVYPVVAAVINKETGQTIAAITTQLCYVANQGGDIPLNVALVLPIGRTISLSPTGTSTLKTAQIATLAKLAKTLRKNPSAHVSAELYPQLLLSMSRSTKALQALATLKFDIHRNQGSGLELLQAPFSAADVTSLSKLGLSDQFTSQIKRAKQVDQSILDIAAEPPFVTYQQLSQNSLSVLRTHGINQIVVPGSSASVQEPTTPTEPLYLNSGSSSSNSSSDVSKAVTNAEALVADSDLASRFALAKTDPVLAAHRLLANLAQIYFNLPGAEDARGVVVAPRTFAPNSVFLSTLLKGLTSSGSVLTSATVSDLFSSLQVGANGDPTDLDLQTSPSIKTTLSRSEVNAASRALDVVSSVTSNAAPVMSPLNDAVLLGESSDLSKQDRHTYIGSPQNELRKIGSTLAVAGSQTVTLTARTGRIPITFSSSFPYPLQLDLRLRSQDLSLPGGQNASLVLANKETPQSIRVETRTSGILTLNVQLVSRVDNVVLQSFVFNVRSTAVSWVAIALSLAALAVLAVWWFRSWARHRRRIALERASAKVESLTTPSP